MHAGPLALSRWLGVFIHPATEAAFQDDLQPRLAAQLRFLAFLPGLYVAALVFDHQTFGSSRPFWILVALRLSVWGLLGIAGLLARSRCPLKTAQAFLFAGTTLVTVTEVVEYHLLALARGPAHPQDLPFIVLFVLGIYMMLPLALRLSLVSALTGTVVFLGYLVATEGPGAPAVGLMALYLLFAHGVGIAFRVTWNRTQRRDFALRDRLKQEVAERKAAEDAARRANEAKSRFLAMMSHEIRTPLNGVLGGVQLLQAPGLRPEQRQPLEIIARNGHLLARLLDDLLDLARMEAGHLTLARESFNPADLLAAVQATLHPQASAKGLAFRVERDGPLPRNLVGDGLRLRQVLVNLAGNAVKFTERGEVVLSLEATEEPGPPRQVRCAFCVRDTGPGLDQAAQRRVFAPFEQGDMSTQRRHGGAGLGLAISRELVAAMGAALTLESAPGQGCRFSFSLVMPVGEATSETPGTPSGTAPLTVLVVDDVEANRVVAAGLLARLGHEAASVASGDEALKILAARPFDAILLDLHMHDMDGQELLRRIRSLPDPRVANLPVFLSSADTGPSHLQAGLEAGVRGVLPKPLQMDRLAALLMDVSAHGPQDVPPCPDQVDEAHVARIRSDLGEDTWARGLRACRNSAEACLEDLAQPTRVAQALHRLAGLAASYGMVGLHHLVRHAETQLASGGTFPLEDVQASCRMSLKCLEDS
ncbi:MAG: Serine/threonine protein kinase PrkC-like [Holophagaceae bacterium]|nr:Serine/threonine protein kinase PrkC-like [Holophagaceae bacterium]